MKPEKTSVQFRQPLLTLWNSYLSSQHSRPYSGVHLVGILARKGVVEIETAGIGDASLSFKKDQPTYACAWHGLSTVQYVTMRFNAAYYTRRRLQTALAVHDANASPPEMTLEEAPGCGHKR